LIRQVFAVIVVSLRSTYMRVRVLFDKTPHTHTHLVGWWRVPAKHSWENATQVQVELLILNYPIMQVIDDGYFSFTIPLTGLLCPPTAH